MTFKETTIVALGMVVQHAVLFLVSVIVARAVGSADYAQFSILRSITTALITVTPLGLNLAMLKHSALHDARRIDMDSVYRDLRIIVLAVNAALPVLCLFGAANYVAAHIYRFDGFAVNLLIAMASMPFLADLAVMGALYQAKNKPAIFALFTSYLQPSLLFGLAVAAVWAGSSVTMFVLASTLATIASSVAVLHDYRRRFPDRSFAPARLFAQWNEMFRILRESLWMALNLLTYGLMRAADILILGFFVPAREVGAYGVLSAISTLVQTYPLAMSQTLGPQIARLHHARDRDGIRTLLSEHVARASIVGGFVFGGIAGFGSYLDLVFGSSFAFSPLLALLLPAGWLVSAVLAPTSLAMSMADAYRKDLAYLLIGTSVLVAGCFLFIPLFGTVGAAASSLVAFITVNGLRFFTVCRMLGSVPGRPKDLVAPLLGLGLSFALSFLIETSGMRSFAVLLLGCIAYTAAFATVTYFLLLTDSERSFLGGLLAKLRTAARL